MENATLFRFGGIASLMQSFFYVSAVTAVGFIPPEQISGDMMQFVASYADNRLPLMVMAISFIFLGILGLVAVVPATSAFCGDDNGGWISVGRITASLCLSVITVYFTWFLGTMHERIALFNAGFPEANPHAPMNWVAWFAFGGMGIWVTIVGTQVWLNGALPKGFSAVCAVKALGFWVVLAGVLFDSYATARAGAVIGGLIGGTAYHFWLGTALVKKATST